MLKTDKGVDCGFPYSSKLVCYILVRNDGTVENLTHNRCDSTKNVEACMEAKSGKAKIYAVWPGNWRSDLFIIEDIDALEHYFDTGESPDSCKSVNHYSPFEHCYY